MRKKMLDTRYWMLDNNCGRLTVSVSLCRIQYPESSIVTDSTGISLTQTHIGNG
jgi:hypothetical protein